MISYQVATFQNGCILIFLIYFILKSTFLILIHLYSFNVIHFVNWHQLFNTNMNTTKLSDLCIHIVSKNRKTPLAYKRNVYQDVTQNYLFLVCLLNYNIIIQLLSFVVRNVLQKNVHVIFHHNMFSVTHFTLSF